MHNLELRPALFGSLKQRRQGAQGIHKSIGSPVLRFRPGLGGRRGLGDTHGHVLAQGLQFEEAQRRTCEAFRKQYLELRRIEVFGMNEELGERLHFDRGLLAQTFTLPSRLVGIDLCELIYQAPVQIE